MKAPDAYHDQTFVDRANAAVASTELLRRQLASGQHNLIGPAASAAACALAGMAV